MDADLTTHRRPRPRWLAPRWLATGGAVVLAGVLGTALMLQNGGSACAAPPSSAKHSGKATFYDLAGTQGNCSFDPPADDLYVALGNDEYSGGAACGSYLDVTGPEGKVRVKVFDRCLECATGHLDLSRTAYKKIGAEIDGIIPITYKTVPNPSGVGPISFEFKEGSSQYWFAVQPDNTGNAVKSLEAKSSGGSWKSATRTDYNFWLIESGAGSGPFQIRMTDVYGNTVTAKGIELLPQQTQKTSVRFTGGSVAVQTEAAAPAAKKKSPAAKKAASPSASATKSPAVKKAAPSTTSVAPLPEATTEDAQDLALTAGTATSHC
ncbi:expansin EXLX1 family cellulose-binding protein [Actinoplanes sp. RD1]|uniref:expansin EXLX1 family cellulose-binding protein n=1 Tax=Actinoplanes sp. RD1 TaxID=3064538 RepID=UPI0027405D0F|nr:expansin EXLX1 family cellulose-binding protein [Actinoplanes sp. RD1]